MSRRKPRQQEISLPVRGGRRRGAGRPPSGERSGVSHARRALVSSRAPVLVTMKVKPHVWNLRTRRAFERIVPALFAARARAGMTLAQFSVQGDHIHLIVEADDRRALSRAMQGLCVRIARTLNRMMGRTGTVFADRYHDRVLATPRQVRAAISYVLGNARKHGVKLPPGGLDPYSSAAAFNGWIGRVVATCELAQAAAALVVPARSWLLGVGWRRGGGLLDPDHRPGPLPT